MVSTPQHSWQARCAAKRDEIERDTRMLDERKKNRIERLYREVRAFAIPGGSEEIMRDLAVRQMGL